MWPLLRSRQDAQPKLRVSLQPQVHKLTVPVAVPHQLFADILSLIARLRAPPMLA